MEPLASAGRAWPAVLAAPAEPSGAFWMVLGLYLLLMAVGVGLILVRLPRMLSRPALWERRVRWVCARPWTWPVAAQIVMILIGVQVIVAGTIRTLDSLGWWRLGSDPVRESLLQGLTLQGLSLAVLAAALRLRGWSWGRAFGLHLRGAIRQAGAGLACYAGVLPLFFSGAVVSRLCMFLLGEPATLQDVVLIFLDPQSGWALLGLMGLAMILAPLAEELLFRGILLPLLVRRLGAGAGVCLSAALFALVHFHLPSALPLFVLGVGLALASIYTRSLLVPIVMHALFNGMNLTLLLLAAG